MGCSGSTTDKNMEGTELTTTESVEHDWADCKYCFHASGDSDGEGCWCPDCIYAPSVGHPDNDEDVYRAHVLMTGMAPPHIDDSQCDCLFPTAEMMLVIDPGSPAAYAYKQAYAKYLSLMQPVWQEAGAPDADEDMEFFRAVINFDAKMQALAKPPQLISNSVEAEAYSDARFVVTHPEFE